MKLVITKCKAVWQTIVSDIGRIVFPFLVRLKPTALKRFVPILLLILFLWLLLWSLTSYASQVVTFKLGQDEPKSGSVETNLSFELLRGVNYEEVGIVRLQGLEFAISGVILSSQAVGRVSMLVDPPTEAKWRVYAGAVSDPITELRIESSEKLELIVFFNAEQMQINGSPNVDRTTIIVENKNLPKSNPYVDVVASSVGSQNFLLSAYGEGQKKLFDIEGNLQETDNKTVVIPLGRQTAGSLQSSPLEKHALEMTVSKQSGVDLEIPRNVQVSLDTNFEEPVGKVIGELAIGKTQSKAIKAPSTLTVDGRTTIAANSFTLKRGALLSLKVQASSAKLDTLEQLPLKWESWPIFKIIAILGALDLVALIGQIFGRVRRQGDK